ncbi:unnamed protein product [Rotaria sp. Silwood1]|nr:unnamed protein product [Rotaria sp. Silwood1]CAF3608099.1 unnamed protein product [Rotaria sp. Silwood1]CAF3616404.1 unnamed protein product [Rotaria sp. Silwood1]CAF4582995.1 unnamed protein product [Rotaria sp. Silwood1]CAF4672798.1 unnamed protein product [Rotaria sp. Silwood1]
MLRVITIRRTSSGYHSHRSGEQNKDVGGTNEVIVNSGSKKKKKQTDDEEEEEDEPVYIESSPCSRWQKRRETVAQRDIPGIDASYLAMDTEEGVEVVWNEVLFSEKKISDIQHNKISEVFDKLIELNHMNIVKFHGYWQDRTKTDDRPRVVFITEYMSSGSLKQFLRKTKKTKQNLSKNSWRRWCIQLLSALNYLHSCEEPIIHGNLTCDTIFIQNTGLLKIGSIAPDVLHHHVKSNSDSTAKNLHFRAPEIDTELTHITTAVDIYSLGMVTLEMVNLDLGGNGDVHSVTDEVVNEAIQTLDDPIQKNLILKCLEPDPLKRPKARELLFHPALFEVPSLKLLSIHSLADDIRLNSDRSFVAPTINPISNEQVFAELESNREGVKPIIYTYKDCPSFDLDKFIEDVQNGLYPITAYHLLYPTRSSLTGTTKSTNTNRNSTSSTSSLSSSISTTIENDLISSVQTITDSSKLLSNNINDTNLSTMISNGTKSRAGTIVTGTKHERSSSIANENEHHRRESALTSTGTNNNTTTTTTTSVTNTDEKENRRIIDVQCKIKTKETGLCLLFISVKFQDRLQRDMTAEIEQDETPNNIAKELLDLGLIHENDYERVQQSIDKAFSAAIISPDLMNSTSLLDVKKTAVAAATAALITAQALQNQFNTASINETMIDGNNTATWSNIPSQPVMFLPP